MCETKRDPGVRMLAISKSKYMAGLQCAKLLWAHYNAKDLFPETDPATQFRFDQGHVVGDLAKQLFPTGMEIEPDRINLRAVVDRTNEAIGLRRPLFEAGFLHDGAYARIDILTPAADGAWDIYEVKSSTKVKPEHIDDIALQRHVVQGAGLVIGRCYVVHVDNGYVRDGEVRADDVLTAVDVTEQVAERCAGVPTNLARMHEVIVSETGDEYCIGPHCSAPYDCPLRDHCWSFMPDHGVDTLVRIGKKQFPLIEQGVVSVTDLPATMKLSKTQGIQLRAVQSGEVQLDRRAVRGFLDQLEYPVHYFDIETFATAIPVHAGSRPYQGIPFQFSLHVVDKPGAEARHYSFLASDPEDPRPAFLAALRAAIRPSGSIVAYNAGFEKGILRQAVETFSQFADWFADVEPRIVDLHVPFRSFHVYHPEQRGSTSIKAVLPAFTGRGYENLDLNKGDMAGPEFLRVTVWEPDAKDRESIREQLECYCALDTEAMVILHGTLNSMCSAAP